MSDIAAKSLFLQAPLAEKWYYDIWKQGAHNLYAVAKDLLAQNEEEGVKTLEIVRPTLAKRALFLVVGVSLLVPFFNLLPYILIRAFNHYALQVETLQGRVTTLSEKVKKVKSEKKEIEQKLHTVNFEKGNLQKQLHHSYAINGDLREKNQALQSELQTAGKTKIAMEKSSRDLQGQVAALTQEQREHQRAFEERKKDLESENRVLQTDLNAEKAARNHAQRQLTQLSQKCASLAENLAQTQARHQEVQREQQHIFDERKKALESQNRFLQTDLNAEKVARNQAQTRLAQLEHRYGSIETNLAQTQAKHQEAATRLEQEKEHVSRLSQKVLKKQHRLQDLAKTHEREKQEFQELLKAEKEKTTLAQDQVKTKEGIIKEQQKAIRQTLRAWDKKEEKVETKTDPEKNRLKRRIHQYFTPLQCGFSQRNKTSLKNGIRHFILHGFKVKDSLPFEGETLIIDKGMTEEKRSFIKTYLPGIALRESEHNSDWKDLSEEGFRGKLTHILHAFMQKRNIDLSFLVQELHLVFGDEIQFEELVEIYPPKIAIKSDVQIENVETKTPVEKTSTATDVSEKKLGKMPVDEVDLIFDPLKEELNREEQKFIFLAVQLETVTYQNLEKIRKVNQELNSKNYSEMVNLHRENVRLARELDESYPPFAIPKPLVLRNDPSFHFSENDLGLDEIKNRIAWLKQQNEQMAKLLEQAENRRNLDPIEEYEKKLEDDRKRLLLRIEEKKEKKVVALAVKASQIQPQACEPAAVKTLDQEERELAKFETFFSGFSLGEYQRVLWQQGSIEWDEKTRKITKVHNIKTIGALLRATLGKTFSYHGQKVYIADSKLPRRSMVDILRRLLPGIQVMQDKGSSDHKNVIKEIDPAFIITTKLIEIPPSHALREVFIEKDGDLEKLLAPMIENHIIHALKERGIHPENLPLLRKMIENPTEVDIDELEKHLAEWEVALRKPPESFTKQESFQEIRLEEGETKNESILDSLSEMIFG